MGCFLTDIEKKINICYIRVIILHRRSCPEYNTLLLQYIQAYLYRDISDQELISCLHDQPRSCTFTTGDLLFVYTQYNENEQHILWFDIYILYINLCD